MASRSSTCLVVLLVLAVSQATMAAAAPATTDVPAEAPEYDGMAPAAAEVIPGAVAGCVKTVLQTSSPCARDVLLMLVFGSLHLSQGCCAVLAGVGEKCVADVFTAVPQLGPAVLPVVNRVCGLVAAIV